VVVLAGWAIVCAGWLRPAPYINNLRGEENLVTAEQVLGEPVDQAFSWFSGEGVYWDDRELAIEPSVEVDHPTIARFGVGVTAFVIGTDVDVFDMLGLADPITSRFEPGEPGMPGHEKPIPAAWAAARLVAPGHPVSADMFSRRDLFPVTELLPATVGPEFDRQVEVAREVIGCSEVRRLVEAANDDLSIGRLVSNFFHSVRTFNVVIPPDPDDARRELC
jgi:hypothetical protein